MHVPAAILALSIAFAQTPSADPLTRARLAYNEHRYEDAIASAREAAKLSGQADAAHLVFCQPAKSFTGRFLIDDSFLYETGGVTDFSIYSVAPGIPLAPDFFVPYEPPPPPGVTIATHLKLADLKL